MGRDHYLDVQFFMLVFIIVPGLLLMPTGTTIHRYDFPIFLKQNARKLTKNGPNSKSHTFLESAEQDERNCVRFEAIVCAKICVGTGESTTGEKNLLRFVCNWFQRTRSAILPRKMYNILKLDQFFRIL